MLLRMGLEVAAEIRPIPLAELLQQGACPLVPDLGSQHLDFHNLIAAADSLQRWRTLSFQTELLTALRSGRNADGRPSIDRGDFHARAQRCLREAYRHGAQDLVTGPGKKRMRLYLDLYVEIARWTSQGPSSPLAHQPHAGACVDSRGDLHLDSLPPRNGAGTTAAVAGLLGELPGAAAAAAFGGEPDPASYPLDCADSATIRAHLGAR